MYNFPRPRAAMSVVLIEQLSEHGNHGISDRRQVGHCHAGFQLSHGDSIRSNHPAATNGRDRLDRIDRTPKQEVGRTSKAAAGCGFRLKPFAASVGNILLSFMESLV